MGAASNILSLAHQPLAQAPNCESSCPLPGVLLLLSGDICSFIPSRLLCSFSLPPSFTHGHILSLCSSGSPAVFSAWAFRTESFKPWGWGRAWGVKRHSLPGQAWKQPLCSAVLCPYVCSS